MNILCIYHGNCADGFTAAWAVWKRFPNAKFHPGVYGEAPPDCSGYDVVLVDFSYKKAVLDEICKQANSVIVLDHHKSAAEDLKDAKSFAKTWDQHGVNVYQDRCENADINGAVLYALFDMERSGARIAWEFFHPDTKIPQLILHVEDRDLWKFELDGTREIQASLFSYPYDFKIWDHLIEEGETSVSALVKEGEAIERKHHKDVAELVEITKREMTIGGHVVWCVNLPYTLVSDACHLLCKLPMFDPRDNVGLLNPPVFGAAYFDRADGKRVFSLRSVGDFDVSEIAKQYGGGGHKNAAGFTMPIGWEGE